MEVCIGSRDQWTILAVERRFMSRIDDVESWQRDAAGSHRRMYDDGRAKGGGVVWRYGDDDGRLARSMHQYLF